MNKNLPLFAFSALFLAACGSQAPAPVVERTSQTASASASGPVGKGYYMVKKGDTLYRIALENGQDYKDVAAWNNLTNPGNIKEGQVLRVLPPGAEGAAGAASKPVAVGSPVVEARPLESRPLDKPVASSDGVRREPKVNKEPYSDEAYARLNRTGETPRPAESKPEAKPEPKVEAKSEAKAEPKAEAVTAGPDDVAWAWPTNGKLLAPYNDSSNKGLDLGGRAGDAVHAAGDGKVVYAGSGLRGYGQLVIVKHNNTFLSAYAHNQKILVKEGQQVTKGQKIAEMGNTDSDSVKLHFEIRRQGKPVDPMAYLPKR